MSRPNAGLTNNSLAKANERLYDWADMLIKINFIQDRDVHNQLTCRNILCLVHIDIESKYGTNLFELRIYRG